MELNSNQANEYGKQNHSDSRALGASLLDFNQQCLRVLLCTARAMANSPGGLRFVAGTRPWLEGIAVGARPVQLASVRGGPVVGH